jgi:hypothetical protein
MSEQSNTQTQQKEIDLIEVTGKIFSGIGNHIQVFFAWFKNIILWFLKFAKRHFWILFILAILGASTGYIKAKLEKPFFESEMLVETQIIPRAQIADRINNLQQMIVDRNYTDLAEKLSLSTDDAKSIFFIRADLVNVKVEAQKRTDADGNIIEIGPQFMRIRVRLWDNLNIARLEQAFVSFIEADPYTQERLSLFRRNNLAQQEAVTAQIDQLKLFQKKNIEKSPSTMTSGTVPFIIQNEERTYVVEILELKNDILALQSAYELTRPLSVIQPFFLFENPVSRTLFNMLIFSALFFCCGYGFLLFREGWMNV